MSFNAKLINLLKTDARLVDDEGELIIAAAQDRAWKIDRELVKLLLSDNEIKAKFFEEIEGHWIFNLNIFIEYISQKNFLDNSYTRFRNRIGLTIDDKYLRERGDVALVWPYKDTVLEGGQTGEEEKRKEIFFNEVLAQDEINRLLDPKVLTNFTRYNAKGKQLVKEFKRDENGIIRENLIVKGNNLLALHTLKTQFRGQVKLIYIDPPYNTGGDSFGYNDGFSHSTWLTFMKNRLEASQSFLSPDGVIFISCDDNEQAYLKIICDDIFGRDNFIACLPTIMNLKGNNDEFGFAGTHEYTLVYAKGKASAKLYEFDVEGDELEDWDEDEIGFFKKGASLKSTGGNAPRAKRPYLFYPILVDVKHHRVTSITDDEFEKIYNKTTKTFDDDYVDELARKYKKAGFQILLPVSDDEYMSWRWERDKVMREPYNIIINGDDKNVSLYKKQRPSLGELPSKKPKTLFYKPEYSSGNGTAQIKELFNRKVFRNPKPLELIKDFVRIGADKNSLIMDFSGGSGTTAQAIQELNRQDRGTRQYILIEQMNYVETVTTQRAAKVIERLGGGDFIYCELMKYNEAFMERIQDAKTGKELLKIWKEVAEDSFLNWYVNPEVPEDAVKDFEELGKGKDGLEKQKKLLAELLDKNQLYVNLSEIEDEQFKVSKDDKALNKAFYGDAYHA
jgi:adenine-specific DNA-methyltransferase